MVVKRTHTAENVAPAIRTLLAQVNAAYPNRLRTTAGHDADGIWPSAAHTAANPDSDHESGNAADIDDDLSGTQLPPQVTPDFARRLSLHRACDYTIHDSRLWSNGLSYPYAGSNPHTGHVHVSVKELRRDDTTPWDIGDDDMARTHAAITITDLGDATFRAELLALAARWQDKPVQTKNHVLVHAALGADADAFIDFARKRGLSATSVTVDGPAFETMVARNQGLPAPIDVECAGELAKARETLARIRTIGGW